MRQRFVYSITGDPQRGDGAGNNETSGGGGVRGVGAGPSPPALIGTGTYITPSSAYVATLIVITYTRDITGQLFF